MTLQKVSQGVDEALTRVLAEGAADKGPATGSKKEWQVFLAPLRTVSSLGSGRDAVAVQPSGTRAGNGESARMEGDGVLTSSGFEVTADKINSTGSRDLDDQRILKLLHTHAQLNDDSQQLQGPADGSHRQTQGTDSTRQGRAPVKIRIEDNDPQPRA